MDTRNKILSSLDGLDRSADLVVAKGWFDVLTAEHCRALSRARREGAELVVVVFRETADHPTPLDASDRAQLVAGLGAVDRVLICDESEADSLIADGQAAAVIDVEASVERDVVRDVIAGQRSK